MHPVFADFSVRPVELSNAVVRHHRCAVASSYVVVAPGGRVKVDFVVDEGAETAETAEVTEAVLRITVPGAAAPMDVVLNGEAVTKGFLLPDDGDPGAVREYVLTVPGAALVAGVNVLEIHNADADAAGGLLRLRALTLDAAGTDGHAGRALAARAGGAVRVFATERRAPDSGVWQPGPRLTFHAGRDGAEEPAARLAWRTADGAEASVAFRTDLSGFHGHFRTAGGATGELRGSLVERRAPADEGTAGAVRHFATEEELDGVWRPAGRLRLLLDDGGGAPLERVTWSDRRGAGASVGMSITAGAPSAPLSADGLRDVTGKVSEIEASDEFEQLDEVAVNLLRKGDSKWLAHEDDPDLRFVFTDPVTVTAYSLTSANDASERDPADWHLEGSHDGSAWTRLDSREDEEFRRRFETREYTVAHPGAFRHYRLRITANCGAGMTQLSRVRFFDGGDAPARPGTYDVTGCQVRADGEPVGYRGILVQPPAPDAADDAGELLAGDLSDTARSLQDAARLLDRLNRYLGR